MSLSSRISELVVAIRTKLNTMTPRLLPEGGGSGQVLVKSSATDYDAEWVVFGGWAPVTFVGTGASQEITLPESCAVTDILMFVDGAFQYTGYSINGSILTTTQPLGAEGTIVRYGAGVRGSAYSGDLTIDDVTGLQTQLDSLAGNDTLIWSAPSSSQSWLITHNLNRYPSVTTVDSAGTEFKGTITYIDINTLRVDFAFATGGKAYLV